METLIPIVRKIESVYDKITGECIRLPKIVVVGESGSGKSSVLEALIGKSFLPKKPNSSRRFPLYLHLKNASDFEVFEECGVFSKDEDRYEYKSFNEIRREVDYKTGIGPGKMILNTVDLEMYLKDVPNLTLVDLPGICDGLNKEVSIEWKIRRFSEDLIKYPNNIILVVISAVSREENNQGLSLAKKYDPQGRRTIAVVTKLDLLKSVQKAADILSGKFIEVQKIIGVINNSQCEDAALFENVNLMAESSKFETKYFQKNFSLLAHKHGTGYLWKTISKIIALNIREKLPKLQKQLGSLNMKDVTDTNRTLLDIITKFSKAFCSSLDGTSNKLETSNLSGGARICTIFHDTFRYELEVIDPLKGLSQLNIITAMENISGTQPPLFFSEVCFETLVKKQISFLLKPSLECVDNIHQEMERIMYQAERELREEMIRFPLLYEKILRITSDFIERRAAPTKVMVQNLINLELAYINTMHPDLKISSLCPFISKSGISHSSKKDENDKKQKLKESNLIENLIFDYFKIVVKTIQDLVPKAIMYCLVNNVKENLQRVLLEALYESKNKEDLLKEPEIISFSRKQQKLISNSLEEVEVMVNHICTL